MIIYKNKNETLEQAIERCKKRQQKRRTEMKELAVKITFKQGVLGTQTGDPEVYRSFIGSKSPDAKTVEEEVEALGTEEVVEKGKTFFPKNENGKPFIYDYQIKGFFKSACSAMSKVKGSESSKCKAFKKQIDLRIFIKDRQNEIKDYDEIGECQRPLRCQTMQGERVSLAISEEIPAGATCEFTIQMLCDEDDNMVREWLDYGQYNGLLQWRNSGKGSFTWEEVGATATKNTKKK